MLYIYIYGIFELLMAQTNLFAFVWNVPYGWECDIGHEFWGGVGCKVGGGKVLASSDSWRAWWWFSHYVHKQVNSLSLQLIS